MVQVQHSFHKGVPGTKMPSNAQADLQHCQLFCFRICFYIFRIRFFIAFYNEHQICTRDSGGHFAPRCRLAKKNTHLWIR